MQNDPSYKDIDTADSGFGEEEMFSSVVRPSPPANNTPSHIAKSSSSPSNLVSHVTNSNNSNNINLNNNNNNNNSSNNNDGFTMYSSRKSSRGSKSQDQPVGPRFRNRASTQDTSNGSSHAPVSRSYSTGTSHRSHASSNQRNNGMSLIFSYSSFHTHTHLTCNLSHVGVSTKYPKFSMETSEQFLNSVQIEQLRHQNDVSEVGLLSLLLALNRFHSLF